MQVRSHAFELPLRHVFTISRGSIATQPTLIVELRQAGRAGFGEATTNTYYGFDLPALAAGVERARPLLERHDLVDPAALWQELRAPLADNPFALCALDQAAHDLWGKLRGQSVLELWGLRPENLPVSNYTIGLDTIDAMVAKLRETPDWPVYKIKLGRADDLDIVRALRRHTAAPFRVDANCGWTAAETLEKAAALRDLGVEFIEQPLPAEKWEEMRALRARSPLPLIADESCQVEADVERCVGCFHGVNVKLVKCGGLTPARRMLARARQLGLKTMVGCMTESTVGISAIAQLLPLLDYVDMDGAALLAEDVAEGVRVERGVCRFASEPGNGVRLLRENVIKA